MDDHRDVLRTALAGVADGSEAALGDLYDRTSPVLFGAILRIVRVRSLAEDILQDVYLKVWRGAGTYRADKGAPITWLCTIARNAAIDVVRRNGRVTEVGDDILRDVPDDAQPADDWLCDLQDHAALRACVEQLQNDQRRSIRLAYFEGFTFSELAEQIGAPLGTVKSWISRGLKNLKGCLDG